MSSVFMARYPLPSDARRCAPSFACPPLKGEGGVAAKARPCRPTEFTLPLEGREGRGAAMYPQTLELANV
jgi:hypothetical protein